MGIVIPMAPGHARTSLRLRAARSAKISSVMPETARSDAKATKGAQWLAGMPRLHQPLTVELDFPNAVATAPVPPRALMIVSELPMADNIVRKTRTCQGFAKGETTFCDNYDAIQGMNSNDHDVARRLIAVRKKLGYETQVSFAAKLGYTKSSYSEFEAGERSVPIQLAKRVRHRFGISVDWLLFGDIGQPNELMALELGPTPTAELPKTALAPKRKAPAPKRKAKTG